MYEPTHQVTTGSEIRETLGEQFPSQSNKIINHIDQHCRNWIAKSPFVVISSISAGGFMDVSPKGDPPGFVKVLDDHTLAIPDRIGNHRGDTMLNVLENPAVGILFVVPNRREVVRVNGDALIIKDPEVLGMMVVNDKLPDMAIMVRVKEAFFHCGKSMIRSRMWNPEKWESVEGLPTYAQALKDHGDLDEPVEDIEVRTMYNETDRLY
ncbi:MSMEG_1061 family FMN-dependent PPOX-type flavoprotein [Maritalea porphyrae]|uniref:Phosphohydrolase n=1 Tax=Maritalea porphyrae TaxID=880732 RepID=A0ABQ5UUF7_9HYPH|nr:MSMEG_1061 family FMN-dependent PPOX-type flavoprotein [Maritalea porphyrae]GLQ18904.1 phosphohydrolase [Maritalea porphyrae]